MTTSTYYPRFSEALLREAQELARIQKLDILPRLLALSAGQTARLFNASDLAAPFSLSRPTIRE